MTHSYTNPRSIIARMQWAKDNPDGLIQINCWPNTHLTGAEYIQWFHACLHNKINRNTPARGRCGTDEYQQSALIDRHTIEDYLYRRIRNTGCSGLLHTQELRERYPYINRQSDDD